MPGPNPGQADIESQDHQSTPEQEADILDVSFDKLVESLLEDFHIPGLSLAIIHKGVVQGKVSVSRKLQRHDAVLTISFLGLWILSAAFHTCDSRFTVLRRKYNKSIHSRCCRNHHP